MFSSVLLASQKALCNFWFQVSSAQYMLRIATCSCHPKAKYGKELWELWNQDLDIFGPDAASFVLGDLAVHHTCQARRMTEDMQCNHRQVESLCLQYWALSAMSLCSRTRSQCLFLATTPRKSLSVFVIALHANTWLEGDHSCGRKRCRGQFGLVHLLSEFPYRVYKCANKFKLLCKQRFWDVFGRMTQVKLQYLQVAERYQPARQNWGSGPGMATGLYIKIIWHLIYFESPWACESFALDRWRPWAVSRRKSEVWFAVNRIIKISTSTYMYIRTTI